MRTVTVTNLSGDMQHGIRVNCGNYYRIALGKYPHQVWVPVCGHDEASIINNNKLNSVSLKIGQSGKPMLIKESKPDPNQVLVRWLIQAPYHGNVSIATHSKITMVEQKKYKIDDLLHLDTLLIINDTGNITVSRFGSEEVNGPGRFPEKVSLTYTVGDKDESAILKYNRVGKVNHESTFYMNKFVSTEQPQNISDKYTQHECVTV